MVKHLLITPQLNAGYSLLKSDLIEVHALESDKTPLAHQFFTGHILRLNAMNFDIAAGVIIVYCMLSFRVVCEGEEVKEDR